jgi:hypothetical protein
LLLNDMMSLRTMSPTLHTGWYLTPYHPKIAIALTRSSCLFVMDMVAI